jgi:sugar lactone lactonase YvrE
MMERRFPLARRKSVFLAAWAGLLVAVCAGAVTGCAGPQALTPITPSVFYPPPGHGVTRLQLLAAFSDAGVLAPRRSSFSDFVLGTDRAREAEIRQAYGLAARDGKLYICDIALHNVHVIDTVNRRYHLLGERGQFINPVNVTIDADGAKYVCDEGARRVAVFDAQDRFVRFIGDPQRCRPADVAIRGDELFVADPQAARIEVWSRDGTLLRQFGSKGEETDQLYRPTNLAFNPQGHLLVSDNELQCVKEFDVDGHFIKQFGEPGDRPGEFARPKGIATDPNGYIYVADAQWDVIQIFDAQGRLMLFFPGSRSDPHALRGPAGLAIDATSLDAFRGLVDKDFKPQYLLFLANEFGDPKVLVYAFGDYSGQAETPPAPPPSPQAPPAASGAAGTSPAAVPAD